jgi:single-stranded-DNA-specific exonuclease
MAVSNYHVPQRWSVAEPTFAAEELARALGLPSLVGRCLANRGIITRELAEGFLAPKLKALADPFLLPDMAEAVAALIRGRENGDPVVVFGDYDVDGVTATAILLETLEFFGWRASSFLPHRLDDGYGLNLESAERAVSQTGAKLLMAVDCGSTSFEAVSALSARGVTVVVLDHHQIANPPPPARAIVNPQRGEPFRELCSAGLAFKLAHAITKRARELKWPRAEEYDVRNLLDLVALGSVADLVPLTGENRILVGVGLKYLNVTQRPGLVALKNVCGINGACDVYEVGFQLGPRLNAAGRLEHAATALELVRAKDADKAKQLATSLDDTNRERQETEKKIALECLNAVRSWFKPEEHFAIVEGNAGWHVGVVGIVASRIQREFHRPVIVLGSDGVSWRGSGRSIDGFDLAAGLRECAHLLERHGGHAMAAGVSLNPENVPLFRERFNDVARSRIDANSLQRLLRLDCEVKLRELNVESVSALEKIGPFGVGNPQVQILIRNVRMAGEFRRMGAEQKHARFAVTDGTAIQDVIWWNASELPLSQFDLAVTPELNVYNGTTRVQLRMIDFRAPMSQPA